MKKLILFLAAVLVAGCNVSKNKEAQKADTDKFEPGNVEFIVLAQNEFGGNNTPSFAVIRTESEMREYAALVNLEEAPKVDYSNKMAVIIFLGEKTSGGYSIGVDFINFKGKMLNIQTKSGSPDGMATSVMTSPYCIVEVPIAEEVVVKF
ncbi:MAG: protease complex subunit PrcB family protein [Flavobacterium sp.]